MRNTIRTLIIVSTLLLAGCGLFADGKVDRAVSPKRELQESRGSLTGEGGLLSLGGGEKSDGGTALGVNSFLWRATLDTLAFMPLLSADPFGGVIITDWYEDPKIKGERYKINALILDKTLRADGVKITLFKQQRDQSGWRDMEVNSSLARDIEDVILTRARELRVAQLKK